MLLGKKKKIKSNAFRKSGAFEHSSGRSRSIDLNSRYPLKIETMTTTLQRRNQEKCHLSNERMSCIFFFFYSDC